MYLINMLPMAGWAPGRGNDIGHLRTIQQCRWRHGKFTVLVINTVQGIKTLRRQYIVRGKQFHLTAVALQVRCGNLHMGDGLTLPAGLYTLPCQLKEILSVCQTILQGEHLGRTEQWERSVRYR